MWYGGASLASAKWAGENGVNFLTSSVVKAEEAANMAGRLRVGAAVPHPGISGFAPGRGGGAGVAGAGRDPDRQRVARAAEGQVRGVRGGADAAHRRAGRAGADDVRAGHHRHVGRRSRQALYAHAAFREVTEVAFALPFTFEHEDYVQILTDMATRLGPALGWAPKG